VQARSCEPLRRIGRASASTVSVSWCQRSCAALLQATRGVRCSAIGARAGRPLEVRTTVSAAASVLF